MNTVNPREDPFLIFFKILLPLLLSGYNDEQAAKIQTESFANIMP